MKNFLIITSLLFSAFIAVITYAQSGTGCYYGDRNGQIATSEISRTEQATYDAFIAIMEREPAGCENSESSGLNLTGHCCFQVGGDFGGGGAQVVCQSGNWFDVHSGSAGAWNYEGTWDVICDFDADDILDDDDNCFSTPNPNQENSYPPQGNGIGDACDCEGDFDCDGDIDGTDAAKFKWVFGRGGMHDPCSNDGACYGDFECDTDVDGTDGALFKADFGRNEYNNPCPACVVGEWCNYSEPPSTTTTMPITTTSTVSATTTTTTNPPPCQLIIYPASETVYTWETIQFSTTLNGECNPPCNNWEVLSSIGSTIDSSGLYTAGDTAGSDTVTVTDNCNMNISDSAYVNVFSPTMITTTIAP